MEPLEEFENRNKNFIDKMSEDTNLSKLSNDWMMEATKYEYSYHFTWMGRPIIQFPQDMVAIQEIIWKTKPDLIIETGIAHGGSLIFHASMIEMMGLDSHVLGIDIDIRSHNKKAIEEHPMYKKITMFEGSSISDEMKDKVYQFAKDKKNIMVILDSNHTHDHVLQELQIYSDLVKKDGYLIVLDTMVEDFPENFYSNRPWDKGNNPKTAVYEFLKTNNRFEIDKDFQKKLLISVGPDGYLKCIND